MNAEGTDWNCRLFTDMGSLLRQYASRKSCLVNRPKSQTTVSYTQYYTGHLSYSRCQRLRLTDTPDVCAVSTVDLSVLIETA